MRRGKQKEEHTLGVTENCPSLREHHIRMHPRPTRALVAHHTLLPASADALLLPHRTSLLGLLSPHTTLAEPSQILHDLPHRPRTHTRAPRPANPAREPRHGRRRIRVRRHRLVRREEPRRALQSLDARRHGRRCRSGGGGVDGWAWEERDGSMAVVDVWVRERVVLSACGWCGRWCSRRGGGGSGSRSRGGSDLGLLFPFCLSGGVLFSLILFV